MSLPRHPKRTSGKEQFSNCCCRADRDTNNPKVSLSLPCPGVPPSLLVPKPLNPNRAAYTHTCHKQLYSCLLVMKGSRTSARQVALTELMLWMMMSTCTDPHHHHPGHMAIATIICNDGWCSRTSSSHGPQQPITCNNQTSSIVG